LYIANETVVSHTKSLDFRNSLVPQGYRQTHNISVSITLFVLGASRTCSGDNSNKQESLANANVSARQPWYIGRNSLNRPPLGIAQQYQRNLYIVEK